MFKINNCQQKTKYIVDEIEYKIIHAKNNAFVAKYVVQL